MSTKLLLFRARSDSAREADIVVDEAELLRDYQRLALSSEEVFEKLFLAYNRYLAAYLRRRGWDKPTVEDLLQSAWIILWSSLKRGAFFDSSHAIPAQEKPVLAYLVKTCDNLARNVQRHESHFRHVPLDQVVSEQMIETISKEIRQTEVEINYAHITRLALRVCTPEELQVLDLLAMGLNRCEIAEIAGQKPYWVDNRWRTACQKIRAELERLWRSRTL